MSTDFLSTIFKVKIHVNVVNISWKFSPVFSTFLLCFAMWKCIFKVQIFQLIWSYKKEACIIILKEFHFFFFFLEFQFFSSLACQTIQLLTGFYFILFFDIYIYIYTQCNCQKLIINVPSLLVLSQWYASWQESLVCSRSC